MDDNISLDKNQEMLDLINEKIRFRKICNTAGIMTLIAGIFFFVFSLTLAAGIRWIFKSLPHLPDNVDSVPNSIYGGLINLIAIGILGAVFVKINQKGQQEQLPVNKIGFPTFISLMVIGFTVCMLSNYMTSLFLSNVYDLGINLYHSTSSQPQESFIEIFFYTLTVAAVPAISEEILFRGAILSALRKHSDGFAILISSLIFGLFHGNFVQFPFAFIVGLVLSWLVVYTNSMLPAIAVHFANNLFSVICDLLSKNALLWNLNINIFNFFINLFVITLAIMSIFCAKKLSEKDRVFLSLNKYQGNMDRNDIRREFFKSPGIWAALVFLSVQTISNHIL